MNDKKKPTAHQRWAHLRFSVVGPLLAAPAGHGELQAELEKLAAKGWLHPSTGEPTRFGLSTIQRWYYQAKGETADPVGVLRRKVRKDSGQQPSVGDKLKAALLAQYAAHKSWSYQLHADNLAALVKADSKKGPMPSYSTVRRFMKAAGLFKRRRLSSKETAGALKAEQRLDEREVRSYEVEYVGGLLHLDFHQGSLPVLTPAGDYETPQLFGALDDKSRVACHLQWYLTENSENLVHGLSQAFQKRGLFRAVMTDGGPAETAHEVTEGLARLGIIHEQTLAYSPYQNGKQENFWAQVEGRLLAMLEGEKKALTLALLNEATQAWVELEYNRELHSEIGEAPLKRFLAGPDLLRPSPSSDKLRLAFMAEETRTQRRSDGTASIKGRRFEVPSRYRHLERLTVRFADWDLSRVYLVDERTGTVLCQLFPVDKVRNADGIRRTLVPLVELPASPPAEPPGIAPLLKQLMAEYAATGLPPAYLPKDHLHPEEKED
jgi:transposase InsO family protein